MKKIILLLAICYSYQSFAYYPVELGARKGHWEFGLGVNYFNSDANYLSPGEFERFTSGNSFQQVGAELGGRWVPVNNWGIYGSIQINSVQSVTGDMTRTSSNVSGGTIGTDYLFYRGLFDLTPEFFANIPVENIDPATDSAINSEGVLEYGTRLTLRKSTGAAKWFTYLGFTYRDEGRSSLTPWGLGLEYRPRRWGFGARVFGHTSLGYDTYTDTPDVRHDVVERVNGGSYYYYSVNPQVMAAEAWLRFLLDETLDFQIGGGSTFNGANAAAGFSVFAVFNYQFDVIAKPKKMRSMNEKEALDNFEEYIEDKTNHELFKPETAPEVKE